MSSTVAMEEPNHRSAEVWPKVFGSPLGAGLKAPEDAGRPWEGPGEALTFYLQVKVCLVNKSGSALFTSKIYVYAQVGFALCTGKIYLMHRQSTACTVMTYTLGAGRCCCLSRTDLL